MPKARRITFILIKKDKDEREFEQFADLQTAFQEEYGCLPAAPQAIAGKQRDQFFYWQEVT